MSDRKAVYAEYLRSEAWQTLRRAALERDRFKCRACDRSAQHVHHSRYANELGQEKLDWLYSLCGGCHEAIHELRGLTLGQATTAILARRPGSPVIRLADAWRLSKRATKKRQLIGGFKAKRKATAVKTRRGLGSQPKVKKRLVAENDELRERQAAAKRKRDGRREAA